jgi:peptidoglycan DL-endopeptidase CwlO
VQKGHPLSTGHRIRRHSLRALLFGAVTMLLLAPSTVAHADPSLAEIEASLDKSNKDLEAAAEKWNGVNIDLQAAQAKADELQKKLKPLEDGVTTASTNVEALAITAFKTSGNLRSVSIVLNAQSSGSMMDQLSLLQQLSHQQQKNISDYKAARSQYDDEKKQLDITLASLTTQKNEIEAQRKQIEADVKKLEDLQKKAKNAGSTKVTSAGTTNAKAPVVDDATRQKVVNFAYAQLGEPYKWGAGGPSSWDCSGLTMGAWGAAGVSLPHNAAQQWNKVAHISASQLLPGDLVFYNGLGHVGIYTKPGTIVHAPHTGDVVKEAPIGVDSIYGYGRPKV